MSHSKNEASTPNSAVEQRKQVGSTGFQKQKSALSVSIQNSDSSESDVTRQQSLNTEKPDQTRIWDPVVCTICTDCIFSYEDSDTENNFSSQLAIPDQHGQRPGETSGSRAMKHVVSTRCGHLFHTLCLNKWFMSNKEMEIKMCPSCKREMMANDTIRIFPSFGVD